MQRFAYFGGRGILLLALPAAVQSYGFGWTPSESLRFFGVFVALYLATPLVGGLIADVRLGAQRSAAIGGTTMAFGHVLIAVAFSLPAIVESAFGVNFREIVTTAGVTLADWPWGGADAAALGQAATAFGADRSIVLATDVAITATFYAGVAGVIIGNGFYQTSVMSLISGCYREDDPQRESGFIYQFMAISLGALLGGLAVGTIGEVWAWHLGFITSALAPLVAAVAFALGRRRAFGTVGTAPAPRAGTVREPLTAVERKRAKVILVMSGFALIYTIAYEQFSGLIGLYAESSTDRSLGGMEVPATWFPQLASLYGLILGGWYIAFTRWLETRGRVLSVPAKFALGMALTTLPFILMLGAVAESEADGKSSMVWLIAAYFLLSLAEIIIWPAGYALAASLAPRRYKAMTLGLWLLIGASLGSWLAAEAGAWFLGLGLLKGFAIMIALMLAGTAAVVALRGWLIRNSHDEVFAGGYRVANSPPADSIGK